MNSTSSLIRVLIVDDNEILRMGLRYALEVSRYVEVVGEAIDGSSAVSMALALKPDVALMDLQMPLMNGIEATREIKLKIPGMYVLILSSHNSHRDVIAAMGAGADGFCMKEPSIEQLLIAIEAVFSGKTWLDPRITPLN